MKYTVLIVLTVITLGCSSGNQFDPTLYNDGFKGITYKDAEGNVNGPVDSDDWQFYSGEIFSNYYSNSVVSASKIIPDIYASGAYPNPANTQISLQFAVPVITEVRFQIINDNYAIVKDTSFTVQAGVVNYTWDFRDDNGNLVVSDIYRMIYQIGDYSGYGDIWHIN